MRKIVGFLIITLMTFFIVGCEISVLDDVFIDEEINDNAIIDDAELSELTVEKLIETRDEIMEYNIYINVLLYSKQNNGPVSSYILAATSLGSGVIVYQDEDYYYILTNNHVVDYDDYAYAEYEITTYYDDIYDNDSVDLVYTDSDYDLALFRISSTKNYNVIDIDTRFYDELEEDEIVFAVGNPSGVENNVTFGQYVEMVNIGLVNYDVIYHTAQIASGNSGGALCDIDGNLLGINTWGTEDDSTVSYAIPLAVVHVFLNNYFE